MTRQEVVDKFVFGSPATKLLEMRVIQNAVIRCCLCPAPDIMKSTPVPGIGSVSSKIVLLGRNPGKTEEAQGLPFIGRGGQLLDKFVEWAELDRDSVFITNLIKCHTLKDRVPTDGEIQLCTMWLREELKLLAPTLLLTFGTQACEAITGNTLKACRRNMVTFTPENCKDRELQWMIGMNVIACTHPGAPLANYSMMKQFSDDAAYVKTMCKQLGLGKQL